MAAEIRLTAEWVAAAMAGQIAGGTGGRQEVSGVSIDTRTMRAGELYIGIRGDRFDGADFSAAAVEAGATGIVVPRGRSEGTGGSDGTGATGPVVIVVEDTTVALQALAHATRKA